MDLECATFVTWSVSSVGICPYEIFLMMSVDLCYCVSPVNALRTVDPVPVPFPVSVMKVVSPASVEPVKLHVPSHFW